MTTFPSLEPLKTTLGYGDYPQNIHEGLSGANVRFKLGNKRVEQTLVIDYEYLTETEAQSLITHFNGQNGSIVPFDLSSIIWSAWSTPPVSSSSYQWRYSKALNISLSAPNRYSVSVELITVPL
tara:strand:- start:1479 stop:1850 length:372 start_codon:yes stop_codon:yes gene_type:complete